MDHTESDSSCRPGDVIIVPRSRPPKLLTNPARNSTLSLNMIQTPRPETSEERIVIAHGGGGELSRRLLEEHIIPRLANDALGPLDDGAILSLDSRRICMTTDAFVVRPIEFPGGDIGRLAVCGTVNDLAVMGAVPKALSLALIIEEGFPMAALDRALDSVAAAAREAGVFICTGDTKVVERGRGDELLIATTGIGELADGMDLHPGRIAAGDAILITGNIAEHGLAVMSVREGLAFDTSLVSDVAPLGGLAQALCAQAGAALKFMRDPTRGGLAGLLADFSEQTGLSIELDEASVPISPVCIHTAEMLGLDPLLVANEGKIVAVVAEEGMEKALAACRAHPLGKRAARIGRFTEAAPPLVELLTRVGGKRIVQRPYGEELPRIC